MHLTRSNSVKGSLEQLNRSSLPNPSVKRDRWIPAVELKVSKLWSVNGSEFNIINHHSFACRISVVFLFKIPLW